MLVDVFVAVLVFNGVRWNGHYEAAVLNAFEANEPIGELFNLGRLSVDDEHLKAGVVIEMRMAGGDDQFMVLVLHLGELFSDAVLLMVEDEGDGADYDGVRRRGLLVDEAVANEIAKCF